MIDESTPRAAPPRKRRWRGVATVAAAVLLIGGGYATANAATVDKKAAANRFPVHGGKGVAGVVSAADAFLDTLSTDQQAEVLLDFSQANATAWSNLPEGLVVRPGIQFGTLSDTQLAAAKAVVQAAMGTGKGTGFDQATQILKADDVLAAAESASASATATASATDSAPASDDPSATATADPSATATTDDAASADPSATATDDPSATASTDPSATATDTASADPSATASASVDPSASAPGGTAPSGGPGGGGGLNYGSGIYFLAFLGTPSTTGTWQLHFGGHHLAVNITFKDGKVVGSTPFFIGVEPSSFTTDGTTYQPLSIMRDGMLKLTGSLTTAQQTAAKLTESFGDVLLGPGQDGNFPTTKEGVAVSGFTPQQKKLVLAAIHPWVASVDDATAKMLMKTYEKELNQTYVAYSGGLGLDTQGDYVRIDGPGVWVEFVCQNGIVFQSQIHFHTVYRDHTRDYGGEFSF